MLREQASKRLSSVSNNLTLKLIAGFSFLICVYIAFGLFVDWAEVDLLSLPISWLLGLTLLSLGSVFIRFFRWRMLFHERIKRVPKVKSLLVFFGSMALTTTPGKVGDLIKGFYLLPYGIRFQQSLVVFINERLCDLFVVAALAIGIVAQIVHVHWLILMPLLLLGYMTSPWMINFIARRKVIKKFEHWGLKPEYLALHFIKNFSLGIQVKSIFLGAIAWASQSLVLYFLAQLFGFDLTVFEAIGIYCLALIAGALSLVPGGIGVTEASLTGLLLWHGIDSDHAIVLTLLCRIITMGSAILSGLVANVFLFFQSKKA